MKSKMSHPIAFPHREPNRFLASDAQLLSNATEDSAIQQALERNCETMIKAVNYLEALCANLHRQILTESHLSVVAEGAPAKSAVEIA